MQLTNEEINNILILINKAPITGVEATTVALLQEKLKNLIIPTPETAETPVENKEG